MTEFKLPDIGEGVMEGEIIEWHIQPGDQVQEDQPLVSVLTDKATVEIAAPKAGSIEKILVAPGDVVKVGQVLLHFSGASAAAAKTNDSPAPAPATNAQTQSPSGSGQEILFPLPEIGEGVMEGELVEWHVAAGAQVHADQPILSMLTDKATVEITAPADGTVVAILAQPGDVVKVGGALMRFKTESTGIKAAEAPKAESKPAPTQAATAAPKTTPTTSAPKDNPSISAFGTPLATPAVRRLASQKGIDLAQVVGSGPHHRITREDVEQFGTRPSTPSAPAAAKHSVPVSEGETREKIRGLRKAIYLNMAKAKQTVPHFTYVEEIEMDKLVALRDTLKMEAEQAGAKLTYLPFIAKACALAFKKFPIINASVDDVNEEIVFKHDVNIGIATATQAGLMVPVVQDVKHKTVIQIGKEIAELSDRARSRKSSPADLAGGTFTITSLGKLGGLLATPIINHPEVAIFGVHNIVDRAVVRDGQIVIRKMMNVAVAFDHRVIDGDVGAAFVQEVKGYLEEPNRFLLHLI
ncbi:MAG: 2-oxo acid dehydrogenase subunit E2 [Acidobacteria bacterium]|nr:2-oxo acid dehydrogenase subunit E2 [Acidobacteriota bacterium]